MSKTKRLTAEAVKAIEAEEVHANNAFAILKYASQFVEDVSCQYRFNETDGTVPLDQHTPRHPLPPLLTALTCGHERVH